jgi:hypothetical protein
VNEAHRGTDIACQDEARRLWDMRWMLRCAIVRQAAGYLVLFALHVRNDNRERTPPLVRLKAVRDSGEVGVRGLRCSPFDTLPSA